MIGDMLQATLRLESGKTRLSGWEWELVVDQELGLIEQMYVGFDEQVEVDRE